MLIKMERSRGCSESQVRVSSSLKQESCFHPLRKSFLYHIISQELCFINFVLNGGSFAPRHSALWLRRASNPLFRSLFGFHSGYIAGSRLPL